MSTYSSTFTRRKGTGLTVWASYCVLSGLLALLALQYNFILSPTALANREVTLPEYLARAGVAVVRIVATYSAQTLAPAISSKTQSVATTTPAPPPVSCTGLGVIVASWAGSANEKNTYIMTDGSLVNPKEFTCQTIPLPTPPLGIPTTKLLSLAAIRVYFSTAYNNTSQTEVTINDMNSVHCSVDRCSDGVSLFSFHSNTPFPFIELPTAGSTAQSNVAAIQLSLSSSNVATPIPSSAPQHLTPTETSIHGTNGDNVSVLEGGTAVVDAHGFLDELYTKDGTNAKFVTAADIRALLKDQNLMTNTQHPNSVNDAWQSGMNAYAQGPSQYAQANKNFKQAYTASNSQFQGALTFANLTSPTSQQGNEPSNGEASNGITLPYIGFVSYLLLAIGGVGIIILILLLVLLNALFRRAQRQKDFIEADKQATIQAQKIQERESQQAPVHAVPPRAHQPKPPVASYPTQEATNGSLSASPLASLSALPVQSSAIADLPTRELGEAQRTGTLDGDKTQPFTPIQPRVFQGNEEHVGFEVITNTNPGIKRKYKPNEDSLFAVRGMRNENGQAQQFGLFVVADGMGGHANGQDASRLAIQTIIDYLLPRLTHGEDMRESAEKLLVDSVQQANQAVHQHNIENNADMGTTVTATLVIDGMAHVANVGDSRTYLYRLSDGLTKVTRDHSVVASLVDAGIIKPDDIYTHPKRNQIYRSLGEKPFVEVDPFTVQLHPGDKLLLCSDGLWDMVRDPEIQHVLEMPTPNPQQIGDNLINAALHGGGEDNVSVIVVNVMASAPKQATPGLETIYVQDNVKMPPL